MIASVTLVLLVRGVREMSMSVCLTPVTVWGLRTAYSSLMTTGVNVNMDGKVSRSQII